jgi:hypothetical protein
VRGALEQVQKPYEKEDWAKVRRLLDGPLEQRPGLPRNAAMCEKQRHEVTSALNTAGIASYALGDKAVSVR